MNDDRTLNTALLKEKRKEKGFTQKEMGEKLNISESAYQKWEVGKACPDLMQADTLCSIFEVPLESLIVINGKTKWRKPYVPEELKNEKDIDTTIHDLVERLPEFLKKEAPTPEMIDYMLFKDKYGEGGALLAMDQQTNYGIEKCNEIKTKYEEYMKKAPQNLNEDYWLRLSKSWNYKDMGKPMVPVGDIGYHRFLVDCVTCDILSKDSGPTSTYKDLDALIRLLKQAKMMKTPFRIGERLESSYNFKREVVITYDIYITRHGYELMTDKLSDITKLLIIHEKEPEEEGRTLTVKEKIME